MLIAKHHLPVFASEHIPMAAGCGGNGWTDHDVAEAASTTHPRWVETRRAGSGDNQQPYH